MCALQLGCPGVNLLDLSYDINELYDIVIVKFQTRFTIQKPCPAGKLRST